VTTEIIARAIIRRDDRLLLARQLGAGWWFLPGGHVEAGEGAEAALVRETAEELGVEARVLGLVGVVGNRYSDDGGTHHELNVVLEVEVDHAEPVSREEHLEFRFLSRDEVEEADVRPSSLKALLLAPGDLEAPTGDLATVSPVATATDVIPENTIQVLDHGFVRLDDAMATDLSVVNSARVSFGRRRTEMDEADEGLIRFLMRDRHGTPFEHNSFRFHVRAPIFVAREWFRHRVGSFNEFSMRYARATDDFYLPDPDDVRTQVGKPGAYSFEPVPPELAEQTRDELQAVYDQAYATYERLVEAGVARELARCVIPVGAYTEFYWTVNARALMNFVALRAHENAQREIRRYAEAVEAFFAERMPVTHAAFVANDRVAP
jgi:thymidylate synthase (FAD)